MISIITKGLIYTTLLLILQRSFCNCTTDQTGTESYTNPCHVNGLPPVVNLNEAFFNRLVRRIVDDKSSGINVHCRSLNQKADNLKTLAMNYPISHFTTLLQNDRTYPINCNLTQKMSRSQITECLLSTYEVLKNFSISIDTITRTNFNFERQNIGDLLEYLPELQDDIDRSLCSIATNGLSLLVNLNSTNVEVGPADIVKNFNSNLRQIQVIIKIYQVTDAIRNTCSDSAMPEVLSQLLRQL